MKMLLTYKQERFCQAIVHGFTQLAAYQQAYAPANMSTKTVREAASRLMGTSKILARLEEMKAPGLAKVQHDYARWLEEVQRVAFYDIGDLFDMHGNPVDIPDLSPEAKRAIVGFEIEEVFVGKKTDETRVPAGYTRKYKLANKLAALELFGRATGYYVDKVAAPLSELESSATETLVAMLADYKQRIAARQLAKV